MATVNCHACQQPVNETARFCPACGARVPVTPNRSLQWRFILLAVVFALIILIDLAGCLTRHN